jgi:hypothetical protein
LIKSLNLVQINSVTDNLPRVNIHHLFVINETRQYLVNGKSPSYIINLDIKKAFDKLWRIGLFFKLMNKIDDIFWRTLMNYYETSSGMVKINGQISRTVYSRGGGILSPFLYNFYINDLIESCVKEDVGAKIGNLNVSILCYCDDIILISSSIYQMNQLLGMCGKFALSWKFEFNIKKCNWMVFGNEVYNDSEFFLNGKKLDKIENTIHLGLPIGDKLFVNKFLKDKFKNVERSFYPLYSMGCRPNGLDPFIIGELYKTFSQSILLYGFEVLNYSATAINELNIRQNILIKNTIGLSKYVKTTPLFTAPRIRQFNI